MSTKRSASMRQHGEPPRVPARLVLASIALLWFLNFLFITVRAMLIELEYQSELVQLRLILFAVAFALTLALWGIVRMFDRFTLAVRVAVAVLAAIPTAIALGHAQFSIFLPISERISQERAEAEDLPLRRNDDGLLELDTEELRERGRTAAAAETAQATRERARPPAKRWQMVIDLAAHFFVLLAWCALYFALLAGERARLAERREAEFREAARSAELRSLRYQVNPHFLFNTLNSLSSLILTGKNARAEAMVQTISEFYRQSLADAPTADVTLADELELQQLYLDIEAMRFPDRLQVEIDVPETLLDARVPGMILQPLIENSVKYAVARTREPVTVRIEAREEYGRLLLSVSDDGPGAGHDGEHGTGIGLVNVRQRLTARFGKDATIVSGPAAQGFATHMRIPLDG